MAERRLEQTLTDEEDRRSSFADYPNSSKDDSFIVDSKSSLLDIHRKTKKDFDNGAVLCIKHPPRWVWQLYRNRNIIYIAVLTVIMITSAVMFALVHEEDESLRLASVSQQFPLIVDVGSEPKGVLEMLMSVQAADPQTFPEDSLVNVTVQGKNTNDATWSIVESFYIYLTEEEQDMVKHMFTIYDEDTGDNFFDLFRFYVDTNTQHPVGVTFHYRDLNKIIKYQVLIAAIVLVGVYVLIIFEIMHRTIAALLGSFVCLAVISTIQARPSFELVISWIDFETVGLLFGMMIMVGIFGSTGFFEWCAVKAYKLSNANLWYLTVILCTFTAFVSAFLDNVTTILLLAPVTIRLCKVLDVKPQPVIIAEVIFSNLGGTATPIGDPPNIIIVNDPRIIATSGINFFNFVYHMVPGVVAAILVTFVILYFVFKRVIYRVPTQGLEREIEIWKKSATRVFRENSEEERHVYQQLCEHIAQLEKNLETAIRTGRDGTSNEGPDISDLEKKYVIHDKPLFISSCCVLFCVIVMFFIHSWIEEVFGLTLAWIAIIGAIIHLVVSGIRDVEEVLEKVELGTLLFFAALFVLMHGLDELGLIASIGEVVADLIAKVPEGNARLAAAVTLIIWVSALSSAFIDNIPFTTTMIPIVVGLAEADLGLPLSPLVWALSYGACFGGNGTLIGASANVVAVGLSEQQGYPVSFLSFFKLGFPLMLVSVVIANIYLLVFHVLVPWY